MRSARAYGDALRQLYVESAARHSYEGSFRRAGRDTSLTEGGRGSFKVSSLRELAGAA